MAVGLRSHRGADERWGSLSDALGVEEGSVTLVDVGNVVGEPADEEARGLAGYFSLAGVEFFCRSRQVATSLSCSAL